MKTEKYSCPLELQGQAKAGNILVPREEAVSIEEPEALRKEGHTFQANQGYATSKAILSYVLRPFLKRPKNINSERK